MKKIHIVNILFAISVKKIYIIATMIKNLKKIRISKKLTQYDIAERICVSRDTYRNYETGRSEPTLETLQKLAVILDTTIDKLLGIERDMVEIPKDAYNRLKSLLLELSSILNDNEK